MSEGGVNQGSVVNWNTLRPVLPFIFLTATLLVTSPLCFVRRLWRQQAVKVQDVFRVVLGKEEKKRALSSVPLNLGLALQFYSED